VINSMGVPYTCEPFLPPSVVLVPPPPPSLFLYRLRFWESKWRGNSEKIQNSPIVATSLGGGGGGGGGRIRVALSSKDIFHTGEVRACGRKALEISIL